MREHRGVGTQRCGNIECGNTEVWEQRVVGTKSCENIELGEDQHHGGDNNG